jgi:RNA polymerase-binding transcription factor DksA
MTDLEREHFRQKLLALGRSLRGEAREVKSEALRAAGGEAAGGLSNVPVHAADLGTDNAEQVVSLSLLGNTQDLLRDVADALSNLETGVYGRCQECGREISRERLEAIPYARYCVACASRLERDRVTSPMT